MKRNSLIPIACAIAILLFCSTVSGATPDEMEYTDEEGDLLVLGESTGYENDVDILSVEVDQSAFPQVIIKMTVKGNIVGKYEMEDSHNWYGFGLDLGGDEETDVIGIQLTGQDEGKDSFVTINTEASIAPLTEGEYVISGSTFTVNIPPSYFAGFDEVKDFTGTTGQGFPDATITDGVNYLFGEDQKPYGYTEPADDDTDDDDTTDDDTADDDDDDSPGFTVLLALSAFAVSVVIITRKRKNL